MPSPALAAGPAAAPETVEPAAKGEQSDTPAPVDERAMRRLKLGAGLGGAGVLLGVTAGGLMHYAFNPPCLDLDDILECERPLGGDLGGRRVAVGIAGWASLAGPILGGLGGGRFARGLAGITAADAQGSRRRLMIGVGGGLLGLGLAQAVAGVVMIGSGVGGALEPVALSDGSEAQDDLQREEIRDRLGRVRVARSGVALFVTAPTFIATGAAILFRTRKHFATAPVRVSVAATPTYAGVSFSGRF